MRRLVTLGPVLVVLIAMGAVLFSAPVMVKRVQLAEIQARVSLARNDLAGGSVLNEISNARAAVADAVLPSVVHIVTIDRGRDFNDRFELGVGASGAGWFWDDQGHIITNAHVVDDAENGGKIRVELFDGRVREAEVVGTDVPTDIAVLRVRNVGGAIAAERATDRPRMGDVTFLFGSPFGIKFSMSQGAISGLNRAQGSAGSPRPSGYTNYIQTDAAMNPGNSGGPLVNANGEIIGMATAIANVADRQPRGNNEDPFIGQNAGIGFSIPLETIESIVGQILEEGLAVPVRGFLGVELRTITPTTAQQSGYDGPGVVVTNLVNNSPASQGGLRVGDIILSINDDEITSVQMLQAVVSISEPGVPQQFLVFRNGEFMDLSVRLGAALRLPSGNLDYIRGSESMNIDEIKDKVRRRRDS